MIQVRRQQQWGSLSHETFDVAILGGGINGACLYHRLCSFGYSVLLIDEKDFATGSSQSSGMMIWGGLLYLRNFDFASVYRFSRARDTMMRGLTDRVAPLSMRFIPLPGEGRNRYFVQLGLHFYWLLGHCRRRFPRFERRFAESTLIRNGSARGALLYEEGSLHISDSRFVLDWITPHQSLRHIPLNYCSIESGAYRARDGVWRLELRDRLTDAVTETRARWIVNCAGAWVDNVNRSFGIESPFRHVYSKGIYIGVKRPKEHDSALVFETGYQGDVVTLAPWGPISLLGPTETRVDSVDAGYTVQVEDARTLLTQAKRHLVKTPDAADIISLRSGVRALAVPKSFSRDCYPLDISRRYHVVVDAARPWISLYGGKITGCIEAAASMAKKITRALPPAKTPPRPAGVEVTPREYETFPHLSQRQPSLKWCMEHEFCHTLEDYLRRRTNIAQWVVREGLGCRDENVGTIERIALTLNRGDLKKSKEDVVRYRTQVQTRFDSIVNRL